MDAWCWCAAAVVGASWQRRRQSLLPFFTMLERSFDLSLMTHVKWSSIASVMQLHSKNNNGASVFVCLQVVLKSEWLFFLLAFHGYSFPSSQLDVFVLLYIF